MHQRNICYLLIFFIFNFQDDEKKLLFTITNDLEIISFDFT